jgi:small multidrug resistance pump
MVKLEQVALLFYVIASTAGVLIIKKFLNTVHYQNICDFLYALFNPSLVAGVLLYVVGFITWLYVLSKMNLNIAYPIAITLSFLAIILASAFFLKEEITLNIGLGTVFCLLGVILILK